jgi:hypothetical protein
VIRICRDTEKINLVFYRTEFSYPDGLLAAVFYFFFEIFFRLSWPLPSGWHPKILAELGFIAGGFARY